MKMMEKINQKSTGVILPNNYLRNSRLFYYGYYFGEQVGLD